jgi:hypothetical protein
VCGRRVGYSRGAMISMAKVSEKKGWFVPAPTTQNRSCQTPSAASLETCSVASVRNCVLSVNRSLSTNAFMIVVQLTSVNSSSQIVSPGMNPSSSGRAPSNHRLRPPSGTSERLAMLTRRPTGKTSLPCVNQRPSMVAAPRSR